MNQTPERSRASLEDAAGRISGPSTTSDCAPADALTRTPSAKIQMRCCRTLIVSSRASVADSEEPGPDHRSTWRKSEAPGSTALDGRCAGVGWRGRAVHGREAVGPVLDRINGDGFDADHGVDGSDHGVVVRRVFMHYGHGAVATRGNVDQFLRRVPAQCIDPITIGDGRHDLAGGRINHDGLLAATDED